MMECAVLAGMLVCVSPVPVEAQWQVADHAMPIGNGVGTGFSSIGPCSLTGTFPVYTSATADPVCTTNSKSNFQILPSTDNSLLTMQHGKGGGGTFINLSADQAAIDLQYLFDSNGHAGIGLSIRSQMQSGTNGTALGGQIYGIAEGTATSPASGGATGLLIVGRSYIGGDVFGVNPVAWCSTTACRQVVGVEINPINEINLLGAMKGLQIAYKAASVGSVTAANNIAFHLVAETGAYGVDYMWSIGDVAAGNIFPIRTAGWLMKTITGTMAGGFDLQKITFSTGNWVNTHNNTAVASWNVADNALIQVIKLDAGNNVSLYDGIASINAAGLFQLPSIIASAAVQAQSLVAAGTAGAGFVSLLNQSSAPGTPTTAIRLYSDSSNRLSWKGTNGFVRTFDGTANSADRIYVLPDAAGTVVLDTATQTLTNKSIVATQLTGTLQAGQFPALTGDVTTSAGSLATTLATVASAGTSGSSTAIPVITINAKGLTTSITTAAVVAPAGTLTGTTLASNVVTSSLTTVGTLGSLSVTNTIGAATFNAGVQYQLGGVTAFSKSGNYFIFDDPDGATVLLIGNTADPTVYFDKTTTKFRAIGGGTTFLTINSTGLAVGVATDATSVSTGAIQNPGGMSVNKRVWMDGLTAASGTPSSICRNANEVTVNAALTCTVSSRDYKHDIAALNVPASDLLRTIEPVSFIYNDNVERPRWGFIAEDLAVVDRRLADGWDANGVPRSIDQNAILALAIKGWQQLDSRMRSLESR